MATCIIVTNNAATNVCLFSYVSCNEFNVFYKFCNFKFPLPCVWNAIYYLNFEYYYHMCIISVIF